MRASPRRPLQRLRAAACTARDWAMAWPSTERRSASSCRQGSCEPTCRDRRTDEPFKEEVMAAKNKVTVSVKPTTARASSAERRAAQIEALAGEQAELKR